MTSLGSLILCLVASLIHASLLQLRSRAVLYQARIDPAAWKDALQNAGLINQTQLK